MTDEAEPGDIGERKKSSRWKSAIKRTKTKLRKQDDSGKEEFKLSDDVNDFLQAGRPSTSDSFSNSERSATPPDKLFYPQTDNSQMSRASLTGPQPPINRTNTPPQPTTAPQKSPRGIPVPRLDVSNSQRWPRQQELGLQDIDDFLRPHSQQTPHQQHPRSQSQGPVQRKKKNRPRNLSVTFLDAPPIIIGEGGDESETPPKEISRAWGRARSASPMPTRPGEGPQHVGMRRQVLSPQPHPHAETNRNPQHELEPRRLGRTGTGFPVSGASIRNPADAEFDMILQPPTPQAEVHPNPYSDSREHPQRSPSPNSGSPARSLAHPHPPPQFHPHNQNANANSHPPPQKSTSRFYPKPPHHNSSGAEPLHHYPKHPLEPEPSFNPKHRSPRPALASQDLRMQYEEGQALRHSHYRGLSNTSSFNDELAPPASNTNSTIGTGFSPLGDDSDIRRLSLGQTATTAADQGQGRGVRRGDGEKYGGMREMTRRIQQPEGEEVLGGWI